MHPLIDFGSERRFDITIVRALMLAFGATLMSGCYVVKPLTVAAYDDDCEIGYRKMALTVEHESLLSAGSCNDGPSCGELALVGLLVTPASALVSGSIVLVGNTVYWMEKRGRCDVPEIGPAVASVK